MGFSSHFRQERRTKWRSTLSGQQYAVDGSDDTMRKPFVPLIQVHDLKHALANSK